MTKQFFVEAMNRLGTKSLSITDDLSQEDTFPVFTGNTSEVVNIHNSTSSERVVQVTQKCGDVIIRRYYQNIPGNKDIRFGVDKGHHLHFEVLQPMLGGSISMTRFGKTAKRLGFRPD